MKPRILLSLTTFFLFTDIGAQTDYATTDPYGGGPSFTLNLRNIPDDEWCYPLPGAKVISPYGNHGRHHTGVDLKTRPNDSIRAAFAGIVTMSMPSEGYGNCVIIRHAYGLQTVYSHNVRNLVKEGDYVDVGQVVALTGRTGRATTEHLHFEVRVDGTHYDPGLLFDHETHQLKRHTLIFRKKGKVDIK